MNVYITISVDLGTSSYFSVDIDLSLHRVFPYSLSHHALNLSSFPRRLCQLCSNFLVLCRFHRRPASTIATLESLLKQHSANSRFSTRRLVTEQQRGRGSRDKSWRERACWCKPEPEDRCIHDEGHQQSLNRYIPFFFASPRSPFFSLLATL